MTKYKVLPIAMTIKNNKIANHGDIVDESQLNSSPYDLIKDGFIRHLTQEELVEIGEDFEDADVVEDDDLTDEEKEALAQKQAEEEALKKKEEEEAAAEKLKLEEEAKVNSTANLSAKDKAKELLSKK
ncbi:hypothetical protein [Flavobacterium phage FL-1]|nr:hypothetical protein [Flavobacterium phage FL-1]